MDTLDRQVTGFGKSPIEQLLGEFPDQPSTVSDVSTEAVVGEALVAPYAESRLRRARPASPTTKRAAVEGSGTTDVRKSMKEETS